MRNFYKEEIEKLPCIDKKELSNYLYKSKKCSENVSFSMILQIHITDFCNLKCRHCYGNFLKNEMSLEHFKIVIEQYFEFAKKHRLSSLINITGGEPLVHKDFFAILEYLNTFFVNGYPFKITLLTNGTLLNGEKIEILKKYKDMIYEVQISLDGMEAVHDNIRGAGSWKKAVNAIEKLLSLGIRVSSSFVISKRNSAEAVKILDFAKEKQLYRITISRLIPLGENQKVNENEIFSREEFKLVQKEIYQKAQVLIEDVVAGKSHTYLLMQRCDLWHLADISYIKKQALINNTPSYLMLGCSCKIGSNLMVVLPNLDMVACRRLPIRLGNLKENTISEIYLHSPVLRGFRNRGNNLKGKCQKCEFGSNGKYRNICNGGGPCMAVAQGKSIYDPDPMCWYDPDNCMKNNGEGIG